MIYIYGDSHAEFSFRNLNLPHINLREYSITMHRIGRDNIIVNFDKNVIRSKDTIVLSYGEVDCRCHVQRQIDLGRDEDDVINELANNYFNTIRNNTINMDVQIIIVGVIPPTRVLDYEALHGPLDPSFEFPFVGKNEDRVRYTNKINELLKKLSNKNGYIYFNPYCYYTREDGTLKHELSDGIVHLGDRHNLFFLEKFIELYENICSETF